jgi:hypothetical protein
VLYGASFPASGVPPILRPTKNFPVPLSIPRSPLAVKYPLFAAPVQGVVGMSSGSRPLHHRVHIHIRSNTYDGASRDDLLAEGWDQHMRW